MTERGENKRIGDAGEKIGGARKDYARKALGIDDLGEMTDEESGTLVTKDNVWPEPDWKAEVENGRDPVVAAVIKNVRTKLAPKPKYDRRTPIKVAAEQYVRGIQIAAAHLMACKTEDDLVHRLHRTVSQEMDIYTRRAIAKNRRDPLYLMMNDLGKGRQLVSEGFPEKIPAWRKGVKVQEFKGKFLLVKSKKVLSRDFDSSEEALEWLKENNNRKKSETSTGKKPERPHLDDLERGGLEPVLDGRDVDENEFIETFGFRGIEFGNWLPNDERQQVLNFSYEALADLAMVLDVPLKAVALHGTNAIAFGARGGGSASAHYESDRKVTNMSRLRGAGTLAHEYSHAIDHFVGTLTGVRMVDTVPSGSGWRNKGYVTRVNELSSLGAEVAQSWEKVMKSLYSSPKTKETAISDLKGQIETADADIAKNKKALDSWDKAAESSNTLGIANFAKKYRSAKRRGESYAETRQRQKASYEATLAAYEKMPEEGDFGMGVSQYARQARALCGKSGEYWLRSNEMFARAMECWVFDRLAEMGAKNDYLVHSVEDGRYSDPLFKGDPYPAGRERVRINEAISDLVEVIAPLIREGYDLDDVPTP